jgi:formylglycine-generating enzyme required for sulfatase activity/tetratricopeptide (TPR) repeat protein
VGSALGEGTVIDISHESLMRVWRHLRGWVEEEAQSARIYRRLHETAGLHAEGRAGLYHDPDLQIARSWREVGGPNAAWAEQYGGGFAEAMTFLERSGAAAERAEQEHEAARQRELERARQLAAAQARVARVFKRFVGGLAVGVCLTVALTAWAFTQFQEATQQAQEAKRLEETAEKERQHAQDNHEYAKALGLVQRVLNVSTPKVPEIIGEMDGHRQSCDPLLWKEFKQAAEKSSKKLHASLALLKVDPGQVDYLLGRLLDADAQEVAVICDALAPHKDALLDRLWAAAESPEKGKESQRLRAAAALAKYDPDSPRWAKLQDAVVNDLLAVPPANVTAWKDAFRPARAHLLALLSAVYRSPDRPADRTLATEYLADYAADRPDVLADLLMDADDKQFAVLYPKLKDHGERGAALLTSEFGRESASAPVPSDWTVRFYQWDNAGQGKPPADWNAVLKSPILDELRMPRLHLAAPDPPAPPTPKVPRYYFAVVATTEVTLGGGEYTIRATADDGVRVWLDNELVIDDWNWHAPLTHSVAIVNKQGKHIIKVEYFQGYWGYTLDVDLSVAPDKLAKRQANAAVALLRMNRPEKVLPLLQHSPDPRVRSYLIHALSPLGADVGTIVLQLDRASDPAIQGALLLSLGELGEKITPDQRQALLPRLQDLYRTAADPGLHAAAEWLLRQWQDGAWLQATNQAWASDKPEQVKRLQTIEQELTKETGKDETRWYVNGQGQTLVVVPGPVEFWIGSPPTEEARAGGFLGTQEQRHWQGIGRSFAIASKKVTVEEFLRFNKTQPFLQQFASSNDCPINNVTWYDAAAYCNWLSEREGLPKEQWCYEPNREGNYAPGMKMAANYLQRTGYRLPTEAEWEFACRAGAVTRFYFGESEELLPRYAWYQKNSPNKSRPVGLLKPNGLGLFDMLGNNWEWCQGPYKPYGAGGDGKAIEDLEDIVEITNSNSLVLRGGHFNDPVAVIRSASRGNHVPADQSTYTWSFRPARTLPFSSFDRYAAARAAALAAAGQVKDKPPLDDIAKANLRRQALDWLQAELADWNKLQPPRLFVARKLWHWKQDRDLAGIRDQAALTKLPAEEQKDFTQLWADVAKAAEPADSAERLEFARVAALLATGQDKDEAPLDDAAKAKLREQAITWLKADLTTAPDRASKAKIIAVASSLEGTLAKLAEAAPNDGQFQTELARHYAEQGNKPLADAAVTKGRALLEGSLAKDPENVALAADLADLLLIDTHWTALKPAEMKTAAGATLTLEGDGSIFVSGKFGTKETYTLVFKNVPSKIRAIRLEALRDDQLPGGGPGTHPGGNFVLSHLAVYRPGGSDPAARKSLPLRAVFASFEERRLETSLTGKGDNDGWSVSGATGRSHHAIFAIDPDPAGNDTGRLEIVLDFYHSAPALLGHFRFSVSSDDPEAIVREQSKQQAAMQVTDPWLKLAAAYELNGSKEKALQYFGKALQRADDRAGKARIIAVAGALEPMLQELAKGAPNDGPFQAELARHYAEQGNNPLANAARSKARAWFEAKLTKEPDNAALAGELADLLVIGTEHWTILKPGEMKSAAGATLTTQEDSSILVSGPNPVQDVYTLTLRDLPARIQYLRLELLTHPSLPNNGPGRYPAHGGFHLTTIKAELLPPISMGEARPLKLVRAFADYSQNGHGVDGAIDSDDRTSWAIHPETGKPHFALFELAEPITVTPGTVLRVTFEFKSPHIQHGFGRFRLSAAGDPAAFEREEKRLAVPRLTDPWLKLAAAYELNGRNDKETEYFAKALHADPKLGDDRQAQHRYHAARAAARAAARQGQDEPPLDTAAKAKLRRQALDWLNAELTAWTKQLGDTAKRAEYVWIDDDIPPGAASRIEFGSATGQRTLHNEPWTWATRPNDPVFSGNRASMQTADELGQHFFDEAPVGLKVGAGDTLFAYVYLDPARPPREIMLQWRTGDWLHRAYWGDNVIPWGRDDSTERLHMGPLPEAGKWVRLEVEAARVGIKPGMVIRGWAFTQHTGTVYWDKAGIVTQTPQGEMAPPEVIVPALSQWRTDPDLAGIRDAAALAKLPLDEQKQWQALWAEVASALRFRLPRTGPHSEMRQDRAGKWLAVPNGQAVALFDARSGELVHTLTGHSDRVHTVAFSPDGRYLAGGNLNAAGGNNPYVIKVWDVQTGKVTATFQGVLGVFWTVAFDADGKRLFCGGERGLDVWDIASSKIVRSFGAEDGASGFYSFALSPDGKKLAWGNASNKVKVWEIGSDKPPVTLEGHTAGIQYAAYSPDGKLLATGSEKELRLWDAEKLELVKQLDTPAGRLAFEPDGKTLLTAAFVQNGPIWVVTQWDLAPSRSQPLLLPNRGAGYGAYQLTSDGKTLFSLINDGQDMERRVRVSNVPALAKRYPAIVRGEDKLADNAERLQVAQIAYERKQFATATRLWAEALASDPKLGDDRQAPHRYNAACAAALAAAGQGQDEARPDDDAKAKLRGQALDWLKAELLVSQKLFESGPPQDRPALLRTLNYWHLDADLAGIRDAAGLANLPPDEQKQWQALWAQVPEVRAVVPTSQEKGRRWHYTTEQPAEGWQKPDFDDMAWKQGIGGFGTKERPGGSIRTEWTSADIWLRREFTMPEGTWDDLLLLLDHDDDAEVYINGVLALKVPAWNGNYEEMPLSAEARKALKPGKNVFAVHCHNVVGPQHIDVGIVAVKGNPARLALARIAYDRRRFALATDLWAAALASDPKLGDRQIGLRYSAARAAALAVAGQANDELPPDDAAKAKLRRQALDWLRAELTGWTKHGEFGPAKDQADLVQSLILWRKESELAGIRDAAMLALLPVEEQKAFTRLWADVAALLAKKSEEVLSRRPDDPAIVEALAGVLAEKVESEWTALRPLTAKSEGGATLTVQPDASVLASGVSPDRDVYVIEAEVQGPIGAIRLEVIPDPSMPDGGSGRSGNFILTDMKVSIGDSVVKWAKVTADFSQVNYPIHSVLDADETRGWAVWPSLKEPHRAVFLPTRPFGGGEKSRLTIRLAFKNKELAKFTLGRFRLSVASEKSVVPRCDCLLATTSPYARLGAAYLALDDARRAANLLTKVTTANPKLPAADWLVLALAHARLKETDEARKACAKAAELLPSTGADPPLRPLLRGVIGTLGSNSPEAMALLAAAAEKPPAALNEAIQRNPDKGEGYRNRADWFADRGLWKEAGADLAEAYRLEPNTLTGMNLGIVLIQSGEIDRYRAHCRVMLERWASTEKNNEADQTLKMIVLLPDFQAEAKQLARLASVAVSGDKKVDWYEWWMFAKTLYDYRLGKYAEAVATCREGRRRARESKGDRQLLATLNLAVEAMAHHRSGDEAGARRALAEAKSNAAVHVPGIDAGWPYDWLTVYMLYREAEGLIAGKKAEQTR